MEAPQPVPLLTARGITKAFGPVTVLRDVGFDLRRGEVHSLMGENGAGKSTLLKILGGIHRADAGEILLGETPVAIPDPRAAQRHGIALIHQEPLTFPDLDVAENIFLGHGRKSPFFSLINWRRRYAKARALLDSLGVKLDPRAKVFGLSPSLPDPSPVWRPGAANGPHTSQAAAAATFCRPFRSGKEHAQRRTDLSQTTCQVGPSLWRRLRRSRCRTYCGMT